MDFKRRINDIRSRAGKIGLPLRDLCASAGVNVSTVYRWTSDEANPRIRSMLRALAAMEAELARREAALVAELTGASLPQERAA